MQDEKKRRREPDANDASEKAMKWADEFDQLGEDDQYTYLEELAPRMTKMHLQFLQGILGFEEEDEEEEEDFEEEDDDDDEEDDDEEEDGEGEEQGEGGDETQGD